MDSRGISDISACVYLRLRSEMYTFRRLSCRVIKPKKYYSQNNCEATAVTSKMKHAVSIILTLKSMQ